jgi:hypothetical protein
MDTFNIHTTDKTDKKISESMNEFGPELGCNHA